MKTILLADDEPNLRTLVRTTLEDPEYKILEVSNGTKALELARQACPDLLLLDWMMPGISGIEVLELLRADPATQHLRAIMLTAKNQEKDRERALAAGCEFFLVKPFSPLELLDKVHEVLQRALPSNVEPSGGSELATPASEIVTRLELAEDQLARYARDVKRAFEMERARSMELTNANARLESLNRLKKEFLAFVCHEMRTPLNAMAALNLYDPASNKQDQAEVIEIARQGYERLHAFITKGLEYFQWLAKGKVKSSETSDLAGVLRRAIDGTPGLRAPGVHLVVHTVDSALLVQGRDSDLEQAVKVLLENAIKYSSEHKQIAARVRADGTSAELSVSDDGVGVRAEMLQEIFQPFTSADVAHHSSGSGLSLALAKVIVRAHGGNIRAESRGQGHGSTFVIELPLVLAPERVLVHGPSAP